MIFFKFHIALGCVTIVIASLFTVIKDKKQDYIVGAYYFDGWTGAYSNHITNKLIDSFQHREPKWGWRTSTQKIIDEQIIEAQKAGISFFNFCWYLNSKKDFKNEPLNNALYLYKKSRHKSKIKHCLLIANHQGFEIEKVDWEIVCDEWVELFKDETYLRINQKPVIFFFSLNSFIKNFGSPFEIKSKLEYLRNKAKTGGLKGVEIAICIGPNKQDINIVDSCGFDILSGYNYHYEGFKDERDQQVPIEKLQKTELKAWDFIAKESKKPYIPVTTLNWDPRPWSNKYNQYESAPYYVGFSFNSIIKSLKNCINWMSINKDEVTNEKVALIYAWNEYGEGAWLTPNKEGFNPCLAIRKVLKQKK